MSLPMPASGAWRVKECKMEAILIILRTEKAGTVHIHGRMLHASEYEGVRIN